MAPPTGFAKGREEEKKKSPPRPRSTSVQARPAPDAPEPPTTPPFAPRFDVSPPLTSTPGRDVTRPAPVTTPATASAARSTSSQELRAPPTATAAAAAAVAASASQRALARSQRSATAAGPSFAPFASKRTAPKPIPTSHRPKKPSAASAPARPPADLHPQLEQSAKTAAIADSPMSPEDTRAHRDPSPMTRIKRDSLILDGLKESSGLSQEILAAMANCIKERKEVLEGPASYPPPPAPSQRPAPLFESLTQLGPCRRTASQRSPEEEDIDSAQKMACSYEHRFLREEPLPQRATMRNYASVTAASIVDPSQPSTSSQTAGAQRNTPSGTEPSTPAPTREDEERRTEKDKKMRYPPLVVEQLPEWTVHFKTIKEKLGRAPNARPFGNGVRFTPNDEEEYRAIQRYLEELKPAVSWFSYSLPKDKDIKVAIRGLPYDTQPEEIKEDLKQKGFDVEYTRRIKASRGRPGCLFFAILRRNEDTIPAIYEQKEILCMPGITIESWRGRKGPAQCHRCQQFRHSSHCCHRKQACVRCGEEHFARECPRPKTEPATCANCKGSHPANSRSCPVLMKEIKNKRVGTVALTTTAALKKKTAPLPQRNDVQEHAATTLMAPANLPQRRTPTGTREGENQEKKKKKKKPKKKKKSKDEEIQQALTSAAKENKATTQRSSAVIKTTRIDDERLAVIEAAIGTLQDVLNALKTGSDPVPVILQGMSKLITAQYG